MAFRRFTTLDETLLEMRLALYTRLDRLRLPLVRPRYREIFGEIETFGLFVGYPRSGHSLIGSLLDAHPNSLVSHRLDSLGYLREGLDLFDVFYLILRNSERFGAWGRRLTGYSYEVPGQWQGRFERLLLLADQEGEKTVRRIASDPWLLDRIREREGLRVRFVHVVRNPYDNITTMALRRYTSLRPAIERYFELCASVEEVRRRAGREEMIDLHYEAFVAAPETGYRALLEQLQLRAQEEHLRSCGRVVYAAPHRSRFRGSWTRDLIDEVRRRAMPYECLSGYTYEETAS